MGHGPRLVSGPWRIHGLTKAVAAVTVAQGVTAEKAAQTQRVFRTKSLCTMNKAQIGKAS